MNTQRRFVLAEQHEELGSAGRQPELAAGVACCTRSPARAHGRPGEAGFTMVELLVVLVITTFGLLGLLGAHKALSRGATFSSQSQEAMVAAAQVIEGLRNKRPSDLSVEVTGTSQVPPYSASVYTTVLGRNGISYSIGVSVATAATGLWRLQAVVTWVDDATNVTYTLPLELLRTSVESL